MRRHGFGIALSPLVLWVLGSKGPGNIGDQDERAFPPGGDDETETYAPTTCASAGKDCGVITDGCGGTVSCGACPAGQTCGGGGANVCGTGTCTTATTWEAQGKDCGLISDGCADVLSCGKCTSPAYCGGAGVPNVCGEDALGTQAGCGGVFNPDQVLDLHLAMAPADWTAPKADTTNSVYFPARFACGSDAPLPHDIGIWRKRSGSPTKPGVKHDFNRYQAGGTTIHAELDRVAAVAGSALDSDPVNSGSTGPTVDALKGWWSNRHAKMKTELEANP
jgi:hypothetical protein